MKTFLDQETHLVCNCHPHLMWTLSVLSKMSKILLASLGRTTSEWTQNGTLFQNRKDLLFSSSATLYKLTLSILLRLQTLNPLMIYWLKYSRSKAQCASDFRFKETWQALLDIFQPWTSTESFKSLLTFSNTFRKSTYLTKRTLLALNRWSRFF